MPLPKFKNEADFRENWILPFLSKMGFAHVTLTHGPSEQGKDFIFADYDRFEHQRFYAVQAKHGNVGVGKDLATLLEQVERCFTVKLRFHKVAHERRVSAVYLMTTGKFSREALEHISDWCGTKGFGENVYCLDGETLERLERQAFRQLDLQAKNQLHGLVSEVEFNKIVLGVAKKRFHGNGMFLRCRTTAMERCLSTPLPEDILKLKTVSDAWAMAGHINDICSYLLTNPIGELESFKKLVDGAVYNNDLLQAAVIEGLKQLDKRYAIAATIIQDDD